MGGIPSLLVADVVNVDGGSSVPASISLRLKTVGEQNPPADTGLRFRKAAARRCNRGGRNVTNPENGL